MSQTEVEISVEHGCKVLRGGCDTRHPSSFVMSRMNGNTDYLLLVIKCPAIFELGGKEFSVQAGTAVILDKHVPYRYQNPNGEYIDDWLHFIPQSDSEFLGSGIVLGDFFPIPDTERISQIIKLILFENTYAPPKSKDENVSSLMRVLLNNLLVHQKNKSEYSPFSLHKEKLKKLRLELSQSPHENVSAAECAEKVGLGVSRFLHIYAEVFGVPFRKDTIAMRISYAKNILSTTDLPVEAVAVQCGYNNMVHFYRQFKKVTGMTPNQYRKQNMLVFQQKPTL
ncbi:MAG: helix-turn-helix transcriptional regulator [Treponema sp.]|nr:helix-turn-helix transcriptional regulator [Treponema sp.]